MRHCPVTVHGIATRLDDVEGGVRFVLTAKAPDAVAEARRRAHHLVQLTTDRSAQRDQHGGGRGGGFMRNCPIVTKDTKIVAEDLEGGVKLTVKPDDPSKLSELRATSRERFERAPIERASVVREETSASGEMRFLSGGAADLDGDGTLELIAGGFSEKGARRRPTIFVYRQNGQSWSPVAEAGWDGGAGSTLRNVEIADVDGDHRLEIVALGRIGDAPRDAKARLAVFQLQNDRLVSRVETDWKIGEYTHGYGLAAGDLDGDGRAEIVSGGFQFDGTIERGFVRVWSASAGKLELRAETTLDGQGAPSMRVNDLAIGDLDGDRRPEIVVAGRHGPLKTADSKFLDRRRESGDLAVLSFSGNELATRARYSWTRGTSLRLRSAVVADLDGDGDSEIVAGGQYDSDGKVALALFELRAGKLALRHDASSTAEGVTGEIKDLVVARHGGAARLLATGVVGDKPGRQGDVATWRVAKGKLVRDREIVSRNADETRARAVITMPGPGDSTVLTIGFARNESSIIGQVLEWDLADATKPP